MKLNLLIVFLLLFGGCDRPATERHYTEITIESPLKMMEAAPNDPHAFLKSMGHPDVDMSQMSTGAVSSASIRWEVPAGWTEKPGGGMRIATFVTEEEDPIECSIVSLGGSAGGMKANIVRWLGQLDITDVDDAELDRFMESHETFSSKGGYAVHIFDLTKFQQSGPDTTLSMIASIVEGESETVFVKMNGVKKAVLGNIEQFRQLNRSLE